MKRDASTPDAYRRDVTGAQSELLEAIRAAIRAVAPNVEEGIAHGMLDYPGVANLAAQKQYVSLYVLPEVLDRHRRSFRGVDAGKSCLRFKRPDQADPASLRALLEDVVEERRSSQAGARRDAMDPSDPDAPRRS